MTNSKAGTGHKLADGTYSGQYKVGDKFVVTNGTDEFSQGSIVSLYYDDNSSCPKFKLLEGYCSYMNADGVAGAYDYWKNLKFKTESTELQQLIDQSKQLLERIEELTKKEQAGSVAKQRIQTELDLAKAKRERLSTHIEILERKLTEV